MEEFNTKSPYHGVIVKIIFLIIFPIVCFLIFFPIVSNFQKYNKTINWYTTLFLASGLGALFHLGCIISGAFKGSFATVINRIKNFFTDFPLSPKLAVRCYVDDLKTEGMLFWIYFIIIGSNLALAIYSLINFYNYYV